jgi:hypothetical protein
VTRRERFWIICLLSPSYWLESLCIWQEEELTVKKEVKAWSV